MRPERSTSALCVAKKKNKEISFKSDLKLAKMLEQVSNAVLVRYESRAVLLAANRNPMTPLLKIVGAFFVRRMKILILVLKLKGHIGSIRNARITILCSFTTHYYIILLLFVQR